jgi:hypothetical protein
MRVFWTPRRLSFMDLMRGGIFAVLGTFGAFAASPPGSLISVTAMSGAPEGAAAYRILYTSTGLLPVSGVIIVPAGAIPLGGRPIVAWAHPTTGIVSRWQPIWQHSWRRTSEPEAATTSPR